MYDDLYLIVYVWTTKIFKWKALWKYEMQPNCKLVSSIVHTYNV